MTKLVPLASLLLLCPPALAQGAGDDGGVVFFVPDASVGQGGADRDQQEGEDSTGRVPTRCQENRDCAAGFTCQDTRCVYTGVRRAEGGGCLGAGPALLLLGVALARRRRPS